MDEIRDRGSMNPREGKFWGGGPYYEWLETSVGLHALYVAGGNHALPQQSLYQTEKEPGEGFVCWFVGSSNCQLE